MNAESDLFEPFWSAAFNNKFKGKNALLTLK